MSEGDPIMTEHRTRSNPPEGAGAAAHAAEDAPAAAAPPTVTVGTVGDPGLDGDRVRGWPVVGADGTHLGTVADVRAERIKVAAASASEYWLRSADVASTRGGHVTLSLATAEVEAA